jgi:hypothetical protein
MKSDMGEKWQQLKIRPKDHQIGLAKYGGWIFGQVKFGIFLVFDLAMEFLVFDKPYSSSWFTF